jgi:NADH:ubiquinone oxidoreductase subunit 5 (subunit L)/multisubunit Na+/H+ antiporter MnhA subunit
MYFAKIPPYDEVWIVNPAWPAGILALAAFAARGLGCRLSPRALGWALLPAVAGALGVFALLPDGSQVVWRWVPAWGVPMGFVVDGLGRLFGLLVLGIGALVTLYAGYYLDGEKDAGRFFFLLFLFMGAMLALVTARDVVTLFTAWEATSLLSFLLIGFHAEEEAARRAALRALIVTGGGGIALLLGLIGLALITGRWDIPGILAAGPVIKTHGAYPILFTLVALGAFTKSAQVPFHRWLPGAMAAPTPASAYLHSATMVKAGIFLLMRFHPALGGTDLWFWTLSLVGLATLLAGAWRGLAETDIKALLAQSTLSQLGALTMLAGQDTPAAFKALVIGVTAHALYKSSLFMIAGVVDHATGTRDFRRLGGLKHTLTGPAVVGFLAALSLAGFPPMMGFLAKETLFASISHPSVPHLFDVFFSIGAVTAAALLIAQAARFYLGLFEGPERGHAHRVSPVFWLAAAAPAIFSAGLAFFPEPRSLALLFARAAGEALGTPVKVSLALWTGLGVPLILSAVAITAGTVLAWLDRRNVLAPWAARFRWGDRMEDFLAGSFHQLTDAATFIQAGRVRVYLAVVLGTAVALVGWATPWPAVPFGPTPTLQTVALLFTALSALATLFSRGRKTILLFGVSGLGVAAVMALEPAPDVALVQILADLLLVVLLMSALPRLRLSTPPSSRFFPGLVGTAWGLAGAGLAGWALAERPRLSLIEPFVSAQSKSLAGASDLVGAIVVEFRGWDTLVEITVFAVAALAVGALLPDRHENPKKPSTSLLTLAAGSVLPLALLVALVHIIFGHDRPGDGFTAGVLTALAVALIQLVEGDDAPRRRPWLKPRRLIAVGLGLVILRSMAPLLAGKGPLAPFAGLGPVPISGGLLFEAGIFLTVLGSAVLMLNPRKEV